VQDTPEIDECVCSVRCEHSEVDSMHVKGPELGSVHVSSKKLNSPTHPPPTPDLSRKLGRLKLEEDECVCKDFVEPEENIKNTAKQDMTELTSILVRSLKLRWEVTNPGVDKILDRVVGWAETTADLRISLLGWLTTREDDQILADAMEMVDALKSTAINNKVTEMGERVMIDVVELCALMLRNKIIRKECGQDDEEDESGTGTGGGGEVPPVSGLIQDGKSGVENEKHVQGECIKSAMCEGNCEGRVCPQLTNDVLYEQPQGMKYVPDLELPKYEFIPYKANTSRAILDRFSFGDSLRGEGGVNAPTGSVSNNVQDQELQGAINTKFGIEGSMMVGTSRDKEESHHHGGPIPPVLSEATIPENGVEPRIVFGVRLTVDPGPGVRTPMGGRDVNLKSPSTINGTKEWFMDVNSMVGRWEEMDQDEGEWLPKDGRRRGGRKLSRRMSELILGFEESGGDRETDRCTDFSSLGSNVKIPDKIQTVSFTPISNAMMGNANYDNFNFKNNVSTRFVKSGGYVRKPCDWSKGVGLPANRNAADRKRKSESVISSSVQTKRRRPGQ
jgi:hypothetical protein